MNSTAIPGGLLVAIEGIDGAGKTTLAARLVDELSRFGVEVVGGKEPTQGPYGQRLRDTAQTGRISASEELALLLADRHEHVANVIRPALRRGGIVVLDRYFYSNAAYQGAAGLDPADILDKNLAFAPVPDVLLLLDLPVSEGLRRISARGDYANKFEEPEALTLARELFIRYLPASGTKLDARASADDVFHVSLQIVIAAITKKVHAADGLTAAGVNRLAAVLGHSLAHV